MKTFVLILLILFSSTSYSKDIDISFMAFSYEIELVNEAKANCKEEEEGYGAFTEDCNIIDFTEVTLFNKGEESIHDVNIKIFVTGSNGIKTEVLDKFIGKWKSGNDLRKKEVIIPNSEKTLIEVKSKEGDSSLVLYDKDDILSRKTKCKMTKDIADDFFTNSSDDIYCDSGFSFNFQNHQMLQIPVILTKEELQGGTSFFGKIFGF